MAMKTFRTLDQAKKDLLELQQYVELIEDYQPQNFKQKVIFTYVLTGNIKRTAEILNNRGYSINNALIEPQDITNIITSSPAKEDLLHKKIKTLYLKKTRASRRTIHNG